MFSETDNICKYFVASNIVFSERQKARTVPKTSSCSEASELRADNFWFYDVNPVDAVVET